MPNPHPSRGKPPEPQMEAGDAPSEASEASEATEALQEPQEVAAGEEFELVVGEAAAG